MAPKSGKSLAFTDVRGGMNVSDPPLTLPATQCEEAVNVTFYQSALGRKRNGMTAMTLHADHRGETAALWHHINGVTDELWAVQLTDRTPANNKVFRYSAGVWTNPTLDETWTGGIGEFGMITFNGKVFFSGNSFHCLKVWDGTNIRRAGMATAAKPSVADTGSGTYAGGARYYKVAYVALSGSDIQRRGELSPASDSFTPSGSGAAARITKPAATSYYDETHWEVYGSTSANGPYYRLAAPIAVATTTYDDSVVPGSWPTTNPEPVVGENTQPPGAAYLSTDGNRLILASIDNGTTNFTSRVMWTPVLGASDIGDDERVPPTHYMDIGSSDGDYITGIAKAPVLGALYVFKRRHIYKLVATGNADAPYQEIEVSSSLGAVHHNAIEVGFDRAGNDCIYFISDSGPYRLSSDGLSFIGRDVEARWSSAASYPHVCAYVDKRQVWFTFLNSGLRTLVYHVDTGGWSEFTYASPDDDLFVSAIFPDLTNSTTHVPYMGGDTKLLCCDHGTQDNGTSFQAYVKLAPRAPAEVLTHVSCDEPILVAEAESGTTLKVHAIADFGASSASKTVSLSPQGTETRVVKKLEGLGLAGASIVQFKIGDPAASAQTWNLDALIVPSSSQERA